MRFVGHAVMLILSFQWVFSHLFFGGHFSIASAVLEHFGSIGVSCRSWAAYSLIWWRWAAVPSPSQPHRFQREISHPAGRKWPWRMGSGWMQKHKTVKNCWPWDAGEKWCDHHEMWRFSSIFLKLAELLLHNCTAFTHIIISWILVLVHVLASDKVCIWSPQKI